MQHMTRTHRQNGNFWHGKCSVSCSFVDAPNTRRLDCSHVWTVHFSFGSVDLRDAPFLLLLLHLFDALFFVDFGFAIDCSIQNNHDNNNIGKQGSNQKNVKFPFFGAHRLWNMRSKYDWTIITIQKGLHQQVFFISVAGSIWKTTCWKSINIFGIEEWNGKDGNRVRDLNVYSSFDAYISRIKSTFC